MKYKMNNFNISIHKNVRETNNLVIIKSISNVKRTRGFDLQLPG